MKQITGLSDPRSVHHGTGLAFIVETSDGVQEFVVPAVDLGMLVTFFASAANKLEGGSAEGEPPTEIVFAIPARALGLQEGLTPDTKMVVVDVAGFGLGFEIPNSGLAGMAHAALALSARTQRPN